MEIRRASFLMTLTLLFPSVAHADRHRADAAVGAPLISKAEGGNSTLDVLRVSLSAPVLPQHWHVSVVGDFSRSFESEGTNSIEVLAYFVGVRGTVPNITKPKWPKLCNKVDCFAQVLVGGVVRTEKASGNTVDEHSFGALSTFAVEYPPHAWFRGRAQYDLVTYDLPSNRGRKWFGGFTVGFSVGSSK